MDEPLACLLSGAGRTLPGDISTSTAPNAGADVVTLPELHQCFPGVLLCCSDGRGQGPLQAAGLRGC